MKNMTKIALLAGVAQLVASPAHAQIETAAQSPASPDNGASATNTDAGPSDQNSAQTDIIITAQRRAESLQRVPVAVSAFTGADLMKVGVTDLASLAPRVPGVNIGTQVGGTKITIRGIGLDTLAAGAEAPIAYHQDGVFIQRTAASTASFFDIARLEVLRGPQGTLYGRNATGGAVNVISNDPTEDLEGYVQLTGGNYNLIGTEGAVSGSLANGVRARIAFKTTDRNGYGRNIATGKRIDDQKERSVRAKLQFLPTNRLRVLLEGDYTRAHDRGNGAWHYLGQGSPGSVPLGTLFGGELPSRLLDVSSDHDPYRRLDAGGVSGRITYDFSFATLTSLTAYRRTKWISSDDLDATDFQLFSPLDTVEDAKQFSQELQLSGKRERLTWLIGAFHFWERDNGFTRAGVYNGLFFPPDQSYVAEGYYAGGQIKTSAQALFGQATYQLLDKLSLTLGGRLSTERKTVIDRNSFDLITPISDPFRGTYNPAFGVECSKDVQVLPTCDPSKRWSAFTPRAAVEYQATEDAMLYASATKGFRSGTYSLGATQAPVDPEYIWSYEAGLKSRWFDRRLQANLAAFYYDYSDLQVTKAAGTQTLVENAATARVKGLEAEIVGRPTDALQFDFTGSYLDAKFVSYVSADPARPLGDGVTVDKGQPAFDLSGNHLPQAPKISFLAGAQYRMEAGVGAFTLRGEVSHASTVFFSAFNRPEVSVGPRTRVNAYLNFATHDNRWTASLIGRNLTNKVEPTNAFVATALVGYVIDANIETPRTIALNVGYHF
jgi:iron complex outermembrane receptor protein